MKRRLGVVVSFCMGALFAGLAPGRALADAPEVEVCHAPPGNPANARTITVRGAALAAHLAHGDVEGACGEQQGCPCFDIAMLQALGDGVYLQQRFLDETGWGLNWVGLTTGPFGSVEWTTAGGTCLYNDYTAPVSVTYEEALVCDTVLNEHALAVGAACGSLYCP